MARTGRPKIEIDQETFEGLCRIQCTLPEIAAVLRCSTDTVQRWAKRTYGENFATVYSKYSEDGKSSVRRAQWKMAQTNPTMSIWWGKQHLGQREPGTTLSATHQVDLSPLTNALTEAASAWSDDEDSDD